MVSFIMFELEKINRIIVFLWQTACAVLLQTGWADICYLIHICIFLLNFLPWMTISKARCIKMEVFQISLRYEIYSWSSVFFFSLHKVTAVMNIHFGYIYKKYQYLLWLRIMSQPAMAFREWCDIWELQVFYFIFFLLTEMWFRLHS